MNHILFLISFGCYVCISLGEIVPSHQNISHYACATKCISRETVDLSECLSDTGQEDDCTRQELGEKLPLKACDYTKARLASAEELNDSFNRGRFKAYLWNTIRDSLTKGPVSFQYVSEGSSGTVSNIEILADTDSSRFKCQYNFEIEPEASRSQDVRLYTVKEGNATWHLGWYYHSSNVHIFRSCQSYPPLPANEAFGSIVVYVREGHESDGSIALRELSFLKNVKFDRSVVQCI